jgi:GDPmannose 4,6-dehydratase
VPIALITGITGQDGSYLAEFLLGKGYDVHGIIRRASTFNTGRIDHLHDPADNGAPRVHLHHGDLADGTSLRRILERVMPDEIYHLGAQSHVKVSFEEPEYTSDIVALGTLRLLECVRDHREKTGREVRVYNAGSSEMFGAAPPPQSERTPFHPRSPYAVSKVAGHWYGVNYREAYGLFVANGILFNHESPRRGETFVTRKITRAVGRIAVGLQDRLVLGNLDARRDWGFAGDYVQAMWRMLQHREPDDFVIATGVSVSVRDFCARAFARLGMDWSRFVTEDPKYWRPSEVHHLEGDASKARHVLGWTPATDLDALVAMMVDADFVLAKEEALVDRMRLANARTGPTAVAPAA